VKIRASRTRFWAEEKKGELEQMWRDALTECETELVDEAEEDSGTPRPRVRDLWPEQLTPDKRQVLASAANAGNLNDMTPFLRTLNCA
jgi:purine nucleoside permease